MLKIATFLLVFLGACASTKTGYVHKKAFTYSTVVILDKNNRPIGAHKKLEEKEWVEESRPATEREVDAFKRSR